MHRRPSGGLAARAGRWSAHHRKPAILGWLAFVVAAFAIGAATGTESPSTAQRFDGESRRAEGILERAGFPAPTGGEMVLVQSESRTLKDPAFAAAVADVARTVAAEPQVTNVSSPLEGGGRVSEDGRSALVQFNIRGDPETADDRIAPVMAAVERVAARHAGLTVAQFGQTSATRHSSRS